MTVAGRLRVPTVLDLVSQVRDAILMSVYLEGRNPRGSGIWNWGYTVGANETEWSAIKTVQSPVKSHRKQ
jgi:hypothetical protein